MIFCFTVDFDKLTFHSTSVKTHSHLGHGYLKRVDSRANGLVGT